MRALVVYAHPRPESFTAAIRDLVVERLEASGAELRVLDLWAEGFDPVMSHDELGNHFDESRNQQGLEAHVDHLRWCDTLIFVYPTWWYGMPAILKGWLDRVFLPGVAFKMPAADGENIAPGLTHITRLALFTTCGASWWLTFMIGAPGKRTILRGVRLLCAKRCKTAYAAHYLMDSSTDESRKAHLEKVARKVDQLVKGKP